VEWFRFYSEIMDDPKIQRLKPSLFKHWAMLLSMANEGNPRGNIPGKYEDIAFRLRMKVKDAEEMTECLVDAGLIDLTDDGDFTPHNWPIRQPMSDNAARRMAHKRRTETDAETELVPNIDRTLTEHVRPREEEIREEESREDTEGASRRVTAEFLEELAVEFATTFGGHDVVKEKLEQAMNGKAYRGYTDKRRGLRGWLRAAARSQNERNGSEKTQRSAPSSVYSDAFKRRAAESEEDAS
jgi:hypothetical protein